MGRLKKTGRFGVMALSLWLAACGSSPRQAQEQLQPPTLLLSQMPDITASVYQRIDALKGEDSYRFESAIEFTPGQIKLIMLSEVGQRLATIGYDGVDLQIEKAAFLPDTFDPRFVLEAVQLIYWPLESLMAQPLQGWRFEQSGGQRRVYYQAQLAAQIDYGSECPLQGAARYHNLIYDFHLSINSAVLDRPLTGKEKNELCPL